ncbi:MAG TPA: EscU/YscU/HrcU family type III secretion system export apparatus switch protein [Spongiibacteraceae bacterium]|jgi:flagellar biosynthesis protein|nr:EscU/YscU/HrcU family type III secretion system export apparatus switch protein [Spongiibacteraceae bacterium]HUH39059.1 EscU/YscU/HrcU family type III secretion system export apparatus switch protein [Spongiibacteraceae bacterium]
MSDHGSEREAVALQYDGRRAPTVTAHGSGELAEQIIAIAREQEIPLFENPALLSLLAEIGLGEEIPETLYLCVAQIIAFAYRIQGKLPEGYSAEAERATARSDNLPLLPDLRGRYPE